MNLMAQKGYVPARGKEKILGCDAKEGEMKIRGDRILMECPMELVNERRRIRAARQLDAEQAGKADARRLRSKGINVTSISESETKRESFGDE
jgi:hypothetical protein